MVVILMGVSGCGKTSVGRQLGARPGWGFVDGDDLHPAANIAKMTAGEPLTDEDRTPWLTAIHELIVRAEFAGENGENTVIACSALKKSYRRHLLEGTRDTRLVYLRASYDVVAGRLEKRTLHFFDPKLLASQFEALEEPQRALVVDADAELDTVVEEVCCKLGLRVPPRA